MGFDALPCSSAGIAGVGTQVLVTTLRRVRSSDHDGIQLGWRVGLGTNGSTQAQNQSVTRKEWAWTLAIPLSLLWRISLDQENFNLRIGS